MKEIDVRFDSGRDVLNAYWGYLSDGGLVIDDSHGLVEGQSVSLNVQIASSQSSYLLAGKVARRQAGGDVVIAFRPGEPHDMLLTEALAEVENVPARRHRRYRARVDGEVRLLEGEREPVPARILNISLGGCCFQVAEAWRGRFERGARVLFESDELRLEGEVVWARHRERGMRFERVGDERDAGLDAFLARL